MVDATTMQPHVEVQFDSTPNSESMTLDKCSVAGKTNDQEDIECRDDDTTDD